MSDDDGDKPGYLVDPDIDFQRFRTANHDLVTVVENPTGWRLWCMRCGLKGERLYQDAEQASQVAASLRTVRDPRCSR